MIAALLNRIAEFQIKNDSAEYRRGMFPTLRFHPYFPIVREDDNLFFTTSILFILQGLAPYLNEKEQYSSAQIHVAATPNFPLYRHKSGIETYNFWQSIPAKHFPNGFILSKFRRFKLPDDIDCTALVYLTVQRPIDDVVWLKQKLIQHTNQRGEKVNTLPHCRHLMAYSTWFGDKMPIDYDVCALSNIFYLIFLHNLPLNSYDEDSLTLINSVIANGEYFSSPFGVAPYYPNAAIILYHLARLLATFENRFSAATKNKLVYDLQQAAVRASQHMEQILLASALMKMRERVPYDINIDSIDSKELRNFSWFTGGLLTVFGGKPAEWPLLHLKYCSEAFNWTLVLEYEVLRTHKSH